MFYIVNDHLTACELANSLYYSGRYVLFIHCKNCLESFNISKLSIIKNVVVDDRFSSDPKSYMYFNDVIFCGIDYEELCLFIKEPIEIIQ